MIGYFILGVVVTIFIMTCVVGYVIFTSRNEDENNTLTSSSGSSNDPRYAIIEQMRAEAAVLNQKAAKEYKDGYHGFGDKIKTQADQAANRAECLLNQIHEENVAELRIRERESLPYPATNPTTNDDQPLGYGLTR